MSDHVIHYPINTDYDNFLATTTYGNLFHLLP